MRMANLVRHIPRCADAQPCIYCQAMECPRDRGCNLIAGGRQYFVVELNIGFQQLLVNLAAPVHLRDDTVQILQSTWSYAFRGQSPRGGSIILRSS